MLRIMGDAKATSGAQMVMEAIMVWGWGVRLSVYKAAETAVRSSAVKAGVEGLSLSGETGRC